MKLEESILVEALERPVAERAAVTRLLLGEGLAYVAGDGTGAMPLR